MNKILQFPSPPKVTLDSQLRFAIANKRLLRFTYDGAVRVVEPHDYGVHRGEDKLLAYQREKAGRKGEDVRGWRWLDIAKIHDVSVLDDTFEGSRQAADQRHHEWDALYTRVE